MTNIYQSLSSDQKIKIFQKCQELLVQNYPKSEFIVRRSLLSGQKNKMIETLIKLYMDFNGSVYVDDNIVVFFKMLNADNLDEIYKKFNQASEDNSNTIFVVFAVFNKKKANVRQIIDQELNGEAKKIAFSREGKFKIYSLSAIRAKF